MRQELYARMSFESSRNVVLPKGNFSVVYNAAKFTNTLSAIELREFLDPISGENFSVRVICVRRFVCHNLLDYLLWLFLDKLIQCYLVGFSIFSFKKKFLIQESVLRRLHNGTTLIRIFDVCFWCNKQKVSTLIEYE